MSKMPVEIKLQGKVAVVTGGAQGIGQAIAEALGAQGADVVMVDIAGEKMEQSAKRLRAQGFKVSTLLCDIADFQDVHNKTAKILEDSGKIDILVNNAGILQTKTFTELTECDWDLVLNVNLKGAFNCCKAVYAGMKERRTGRIVSIASLAGKSGGIGVSANYAVSKGGVIILTRCLARDLAPYGITVNCLAPGLTETSMSAIFSAQQKKKVMDGIPLGRLAAPEEIASMVLFLCSDYADYITGETININGGLLMD